MNRNNTIINISIISIIITIVAFSIILLSVLFHSINFLSKLSELSDKLTFFLPLYNSFKVSLISLIISLPFALFLSNFFTEYDSNPRNILINFFLYLKYLPSVIIVYSVFIFFDDYDIKLKNELIISLILSVSIIPYLTITFAKEYNKLKDNYLTSSFALGLNSFDVFRVKLRLIFKNIVMICLSVIVFLTFEVVIVSVILFNFQILNEKSYVGFEIIQNLNTNSNELISFYALIALTLVYFLNYFKIKINQKDNA